jgi:apolipoprotein N-acyltransferase
LGVLLFCGYAIAPSLGFLPYVALVPWTILYMDPRRPKAASLYFLLVGYLCWIVFVPPAKALFFIPAWVLFPLLARPIQRLGLPRSITLPFIWVAVEWARLLLAIGHFDLFALGYSQARCLPLVQIADLTGVYGVSFLVAAVNGLFADAFFVLKGVLWRPRIVLRQRRVAIPAIAIAAAFAAVFAYGVFRLDGTTETEGPRMAIVQPRTAKDVPAGSVDLIVWPERAILADVAQLAAGKQAAVLFGGTTSSMSLVDGSGTLRRTGSRMTLFALPWKDGTLPFAALIGVSNSYPPPIAEAGRKGARFLVDLTGGGEIDGAIQEQLLRVCMMRAIENRIVYVRAGATRFSGFIDRKGRFAGAPTGTVALSSGGTTVYAASHDAFALMCVAVSLWLLARALLRGRPTLTPLSVPAAATATIIVAALLACGCR